MKTSFFPRQLARPFILFGLCLAAAAALAQSARDTLGPGDSVRITVFRYPDLTTEARTSDSCIMVSQFP